MYRSINFLQATIIAFATVFTSAPITWGAERLTKDSVVTEGEYYLGHRGGLSAKRVVSILELLPAGKVKVRFRGLGEGFDEIKSKTELETIEVVTATETVKEGDRFWFDEHGGQSSLKEVEVIGVMPNKSIVIHYVDRSEAWDKAVPRRQLCWVDARPQRGGAAAKPSSKKKEDTATSSSADPDLRTWTDVTGKFKIKAKFSEISDNKVRLVKTDGKTIELPLEKLSPADRKHIEELLNGEGSEAEQGGANPFAAAD